MANDVILPQPGEAARVEFERIGRKREVPPLDVPAGLSANGTAELLHKYVGKFLGSSEYTVMVDYRDGTVSIDGGRFGTGKLVPA